MSGSVRPTRSRSSSGAFTPVRLHEVRIFLNGGNDRAVIRGQRTSEILLRVIGGDGDDVFEDRIAHGDVALLLYDEAGTR